MDPVSVIVAAVIAGASAAAKESATDAVKEAYRSLKSLIRSKFGSNEEDQALLSQQEESPESNPEALQLALKRVGADNDEGLLEAARSMLEAAGPAAEAKGKYAVAISGGNVKGLVQGDGANVTMNFGD